MKIDWTEVARKHDIIQADGGERMYGDKHRNEVLADILGHESLIAAAELCINMRIGSGWNLAESILRLLRPPHVLDYCYSVYKNDTNDERRGYAVRLIGQMADRRRLGWLHEFLDDPNETVQNWAATSVERFLQYGELDLEEVCAEFRQMASHSNPYVRGKYAEFMTFTE